MMQEVILLPSGTPPSPSLRHSPPHHEVVTGSIHYTSIWFPKTLTLQNTKSLRLHKPTYYPPGTGVSLAASSLLGVGPVSFFL